MIHLPLKSSYTDSIRHNECRNITQIKQNWVSQCRLDLDIRVWQLNTTAYRDNNPGRHCTVQYTPPFFPPGIRQRPLPLDEMWRYHLDHQNEGNMSYLLGRSLMIGWRKNSWNPERVPTVVTFVSVMSVCLFVCLSVCLSAAYRSHLLP